jgi:hypothetical protein
VHAWRRKNQSNDCDAYFSEGSTNNRVEERFEEEDGCEQCRQMSWERQRESVGAQVVYRHIAIESSETEGAKTPSVFKRANEIEKCNDKLRSQL